MIQPVANIEALVDKRKLLTDKVLSLGYIVDWLQTQVITILKPAEKNHYCTARQCSPLRRKFMECYIIKPAQSLLMKHLVIGQR